MKSIYNESRYLNEDLEALNYFSKARKLYKKYEEESLEQNKDIIKYYDVYLDIIVDELLKYNFKSSLDYSIALGYLIKKGYLSEGLKFDSEVTDKEIKGKLGISILEGSGCCRNISDMHKDIFEKLNINIIPFYCYQGVNFINRGLEKEANHIINLVEYKDNLYGIDLYNDNVLYGFKNSFVMKSISSIHDESLRYKPYYELIVEDKTINDIKDRIELFKDCSKKKPINYFEYEMGIRYEVENTLFDNRDKLNDFHNKTKLLRKNIISRMSR